MSNFIQNNLQNLKQTISIYLIACFFSLFFITETYSATHTLLGISTFSIAEKRIIQSLSKRNFSPEYDAGNRISGNPQAIAWGKQLFFDQRLSGDGQFSCASCHDPQMGWGKHEAMTTIRQAYPAKRHVPSLWGIRYNRWYFWDGRADSLWSQALIPLEDPAEMAASRIQIARLIIKDKALRQSYQALFGNIPELLLQTQLPMRGKPMEKNKAHADHQAWSRLSKSVKQAINHLFANIGKAIASFEETLVATDSPFDRFADQLLKAELSHESPSHTALSPQAIRGLRLFIGKAACVNCHFGANFSDGEFHHSFLQPLSLTGDLGRYNGIPLVLNNMFNSYSVYHDANKKTTRNKLDYVYNNVLFRNQFKTPSLRNVALTYPYMHTGEFKTLADVMNYYNTISERIKPKNHEEVLLTSLKLSNSEQNDIIEFLQALTDESAIEKQQGGR